MNQAQKEIDALMNELRNGEQSTEPLLAIHQIDIMRGKNKGFPMHMYHPTLEPRVVINTAQRDALLKAGYSLTYTKQEFPMMIFRRNTEPRFAPDFVETRTVPSKQVLDSLINQRHPANCGPWVDTPANIEPIADGPSEDPAVTIARLEGQLAALQGEEPKKKGK